MRELELKVEHVLPELGVTRLLLAHALVVPLGDLALAGVRAELVRHEGLLRPRRLLLRRRAHLAHLG